MIPGRNRPGITRAIPGRLECPQQLLLQNNAPASDRKLLQSLQIKCLARCAGQMTGGQGDVCAVRGNGFCKLKTFCLSEPEWSPD